MKKIIVPLDGSELADGVLKHVERLLGQEPCEVTLLRVLPPQDAVEEVPGQFELERRAAEVHLDNVALRLTEVGARVKKLTRQGDPAAEIIFAVDELGPDLVAMSSHGRGGVMRWIRGSVAERVLRSSPASLLLITAKGLDRNIEQRLRRILVPLDGTETSARVLPLVQELAGLHGAEVLLLRVERGLLVASRSPEEVAASLDPQAERLRQQGLAVRVVAARGDPASQVLDLAEDEDVDLIAMVSSGRTGVERVIEGSVTEKVLRHGRRPLLVVRV